MGIQKEIEKTKSRLSKKVLAYERRYIKSEDGIIGLELSILVDEELDRLRDKFLQMIKRVLLEEK